MRVQGRERLGLPDERGRAARRQNPGGDCPFRRWLELHDLAVLLVYTALMATPQQAPEAEVLRPPLRAPAARSPGFGGVGCATAHARSH